MGIIYDMPDWIRLYRFCSARIRVLALPVLIVVGASSITSKVQAAVNAPFLYYYSQEQAAFIVERADGSDHRILVAYSLAPDSNPTGEVHTIIIGPGWSPSGNWFTWRETTNYGGVSSAYVVSRDGRSRYTLLNGLAVISMEWSPIKDLLLVTTPGYKAYIIDMQSPNTPKLIDDHIEDSIVYWTRDGRYAVVITLNQEQPDEMKLFSPDGTGQNREFYQGGRGCAFPVWSSNDRVAYLDATGKRLIVENFADGQQLGFDIPKGSIRQLIWSPDENYILVYTSDDCSAQKDLNLTLLSLRDKRSALISDVAQLLPSPTSYDNFSFPSWSADSNNIIFLTSSRHIFMVALPSLQSYQISPPQMGFSSFVQWESNDVLAFIWTAEDISHSTVNIYTYGLATHTLDNALSRTNQILAAPPGYFSFASDRKYLGMANGLLYIVDQHTDHVTAITVKDEHLNPTKDIILGNINQFLWSPHGNWLITLSVESPYLLNVVNIDGTIQRELSVCPTSTLPENGGSCFGWLPDKKTLN
jgi:hypothetical protein